MKGSKSDDRQLLKSSIGRPVSVLRGKKKRTLRFLSNTPLPQVQGGGGNRIKRAFDNEKKNYVT